ncbi:MAG TPA: hypothetical protein VHE30_22240 [Polyangiaceae bacterium]|nr:hypothetical protein [Polyangiaceae bacterium]
MKLRATLPVRSLAAAFVLCQAAGVSAAPVPSGAHPRLFMSAGNVTAFGKNASAGSTAAANLVQDCDEALSSPNDRTTRGGADGDTWPGTAMRCAFAYRATGDAKYLAPALKYWKAALEDDQDLGDKLGCVPGVSTDFSGWDGSPPAPPVIITVTHDTGYPMRWYGPYVSLVYDWLYDAPGVDDALRAQTRTCLGAWIDYYTDRGYHHDEAGANYNAGYVIGKTLAAIAIGNDGGADGHLWTETTTDLFPKLLVGQGLAGMDGKVGEKAGALVGGDWAEGWQYGPLSVLEYAVATRALEENGVALPEMDAWTDSIGVRLIHGMVPTKDGQWVGGDFDSDSPYQSPALNQLDAVLAGPSSAEAASWAAFEKKGRGAGDYFYNALGELRDVTPADYRARTPAPPLWYLARGTRAMYVRTSWDESAFWSVFSSAPAVVSDHEHFSAGNFVFTRGADHLVVDPSNYGEYDTFATNAPTADSTVAQGDYGGTQTPWSEAELLWARGTSDGAYAARSDFAKAFIFSDTPSDIPYAHREWAMLPEGEIVTIDRIHTKDAAHAMHVQFHTNTGGGGLTLSGSVASGTVGGSALAIHAVSLSGGTPAVSTPDVGDCKISCSYPCGLCDTARFPVDEYSVAVPGPNAVAIHVIDGLASGEAQADVGSIGEDRFDPAPKQNDGVIGAVVQRASKVTYVLASSAVDGASPTTMTYGVPGGAAGRHIVFDAPEDANGKSKVTATAQGDRCLLSITAGDGLAGHPLMFTVATSADGCTVTDGTDVPAGSPVGEGGRGSGGATGGGASSGTGGTTSGGGSTNGGSSGENSADGGTAAPAAKDSGGCGCRVESRAGGDAGRVGVLGAVGLSLLLARRRARRSGH